MLCVVGPGAVVSSHPVMEPAVRYMDLRTETLSIFEKVGSFLADLCDGSGTHQGAAECSSLDSNLGSFYETFSRLQARHGDQTLTVAVLALTKSGRFIQPFAYRTFATAREFVPELACVSIASRQTVEARKLA